LILEDDADWDVRIKDQLYDFALTSNGLTQPLSSNPSKYADSTFPTPQDISSLPEYNISYDELPSTRAPRNSPYGDNWDILWLGHCGMVFPTTSSAGAKAIPKGRVAHVQDLTVPPLDKISSALSPFDLPKQYPAHTRVTHHVSGGACSLGYAVTQAGARSLLYWLGLREIKAAMDLMLSMACDGTSGKAYHTCLTVQPPLFNHYRAVGKPNFESEISSHGDEYREKAWADNMQWSVRMNFEGLIKGQSTFVDQYPNSN
jgi:hypothetical protein